VEPITNHQSGQSSIVKLVLAGTSVFNPPVGFETLG
jgi:hypothetical protein